MTTETTETTCECGKHRKTDGRWVRKDGLTAKWDPILGMIPTVPCEDVCGDRLDCGGECCLDRGHDARPHECIGDEPGEPGTCPA